MATTNEYTRFKLTIEAFLANAIAYGDADILPHQADYLKAALLTTALRVPGHRIYIEWVQPRNIRHFRKCSDYYLENLKQKWFILVEYDVKEKTTTLRCGAYQQTLVQEWLASEDCAI